MSAKLAIVVIVVVAIALGSDQSWAAPEPTSGGLSYQKLKFTRCDGSTDPIGKIEISACPSTQDDDHCIIKAGSNVTVEIEFTPHETHEESRFGLYVGKSGVGTNVCTAEGAKCPLEAGVKQHIKQEFSLPVFMDDHNDIARLVLYKKHYLVDKFWYCVEFPAYVL